MAFGRVLPNHCFVGKNVIVRYHVFYKFLVSTAVLNLLSTTPPLVVVLCFKPPDNKF